MKNNRYIGVLLCCFITFTANTSIKRTESEEMSLPDCLEPVLREYAHRRGVIDAGELEKMKDHQQLSCSIEDIITTLNKVDHNETTFATYPAPKHFIFAFSKAIPWFVTQKSDIKAIVDNTKNFSLIKNIIIYLLVKNKPNNNKQFLESYQFALTPQIRDKVFRSITAYEKDKKLTDQLAGKSPWTEFFYYHKFNVGIASTIGIGTLIFLILARNPIFKNIFESKRDIIKSWLYRFMQ